MNAKSEREAERQKNLIAAGRCARCRELRGDDGTGRYCRSCAKKHAARVSGAHKAMHDAGKCIRCGDDVDGASWKCAVCRDKESAYSRARYAARKESAA